MSSHFLQCLSLARRRSNLPLIVTSTCNLLARLSFYHGGEASWRFVFRICSCFFCRYKILICLPDIDSFSCPAVSSWPIVSYPSTHIISLTGNPYLQSCSLILFTSYLNHINKIHFTMWGISYWVRLYSPPPTPKLTSV
jgi:hypothetical protein